MVKQPPDRNIPDPEFPEDNPPPREKDKQWREYQLRRAEQAMRVMLQPDGGFAEFIEPIDVPVTHAEAEQQAAASASIIDVSADPVVNEELMQHLEDLARPPTLPEIEPEPAMEALEVDPNWDMPPLEVQAPGLRVQEIEQPEPPEPVAAEPPERPIEEPELPKQEPPATAPPPPPDAPLPEPSETPPPSEPPETAATEFKPFSPGLGRPLAEGESREGLLAKIRDDYQQRRRAEPPPQVEKQRATPHHGAGATISPEFPIGDFGEQASSFFELGTATDENLYAEAERATDSVMIAGEALIDILRKLTRGMERLTYMMGALQDRLDSEDDCDAF